MCNPIPESVVLQVIERTNVLDMTAESSDKVNAELSQNAGSALTDHCQG